MAATNNITSSITLVSTTQQTNLGRLFSRPSATLNRPDETWIYVKNSTGAAWAIGNAVARVADDLTRNCTMAPASSSAERVVGVAQIAVPAGSYAWVLREGTGSVKAAAAAITENDALSGGLIIGATAGCFTQLAAVIDGQSLGYCPTAVDAGELGTANIRCVG